MTANATTKAERAAVIAELAEQWEERPRLRLGQLLGRLHGEPLLQDDFYLLPGARARIEVRAKCDEPMCGGTGKLIGGPNDPPGARYETCPICNGTGEKKPQARAASKPEPTGEELQERHFKANRSHAEGYVSIYREGRADGRAEQLAERARKRGPRPANPVTPGRESHGAWEDGFDAGAVWAESGDSERDAEKTRADRAEGETAELKEELRAQRRMMAAAAGLDFPDGFTREDLRIGLTQLVEAHDCLANKVPEALAELTQAKARIAELKAELAELRTHMPGEWLQQQTANANALNQTLTKELAEARDELRIHGVRETVLRGQHHGYLSDVDCAMLDALDVHRAKSSSSAGSAGAADNQADAKAGDTASCDERSAQPDGPELPADDGPPRVGDVVGLEFRGGEYMVENVVNGFVHTVGGNGGWYPFDRVTIVRRASRPPETVPPETETLSDEVEGLKRRVRALEKRSHEPYDFTDLLSRVGRLEARLEDLWRRQERHSSEPCAEDLKKGRG